MKIVNYGSTFKIYEDDLKTFDQLPAGTYKVDFHPMSGFSLERTTDFEAIEDQIYGEHEAKIQKVLNSYAQFERSLGVILSGNKGMGKSLFGQLLSESVIKKFNMPIIIVNKPFVGIADFIDSIDQECLVFFDEFEKVFDERKEHTESQDSLLGLFDGTSQKKRMYVITVNNLNRVNEFMLSRPGRFHYHLRFDYPNSREIEIYLKDKVKEQYHAEIKQVVSFAHRVKLNYDSLRAIAFELNQGYSFKTAISDLNILMTDRQEYDIEISFSNGKKHTARGYRLDIFAQEVEIELYVEGSDYIEVSFASSSLNSNSLDMYVSGEDVKLYCDSENKHFTSDLEVRGVVIQHTKDRGVNYKLAF